MHMWHLVHRFLKVTSRDCDVDDNTPVTCYLMTLLHISMKELGKKN